MRALGVLLPAVLVGVNGECFADDRDRAMQTLWTNNYMTPTLCNGFCGDRGYHYYGLQWSIECWCAEKEADVSRHGPGTCDFPCGGDPSQMCGGYWAFELYEVGTLPGARSPTKRPTQKSLSSTPKQGSPAPQFTSTSLATVPKSISPKTLMTLPSKCEASLPSFRFSSSAGLGGRMYAEGEGCFTPTDLYEFQGAWNDGRSKGPLFVLDASNNVDLTAETPTGKWLLTSEMFIEGGAIFYCRGSSIGGDCDEFRIESTGPSNYHEVRGWGGSLYFESTVVTSWDTPNKKPQEKYDGGRSFLNCVSERVNTCTVNDKGECRMDMINSEIAYLGYFAPESYGITWKVRGFCTDLSNPEVFEVTDVYGDIIGCDIHHNYYGHYTYGHEGGVWINNKMHDNPQYGFDPHDDSDYLIIAGNEVYNNENHAIIASKRCNNVHIYDNDIYGGGKIAVGIFLHRSGDFAEVYNNKVHDMQDAGFAFLESFDGKVYSNEVDGGEFGIRLHLGSARNEVYGNVFNGVSEAGLYTYIGSDPPEVNDGRPFDNVFFDNTVTNSPVAVKLKHSVDMVIKDNTFKGVTTIEFNDAKGTRWTGNSLPSGACLMNHRGDSTFASSSGLPEISC